MRDTLSCPLCSWSMETREVETLSGLASARIAASLGISPEAWTAIAINDHQREIEETLREHFATDHTLAEWVGKVIELQSKLAEMQAHTPRELRDY